MRIDSLKAAYHGVMVGISFTALSGTVLGTVDGVSDIGAIFNSCLLQDLCDLFRLGFVKLIVLVCVVWKVTMVCTQPSKGFNTCKLAKWTSNGVSTADVLIVCH